MRRAFRLVPDRVAPLGEGAGIAAMKCCADEPTSLAGRVRFWIRRVYVARGRAIAGAVVFRIAFAECRGFEHARRL